MGTKLTRRADTEAGFSLIELLVVIAVVSVLTVGVVLTTGRGDPDAGTDMARFQTSFERMQGLAVQGRRAHGLVVTARGLQTAQATDAGWSVSETVQTWRARPGFLPRGAPAAPDTPDIRFLPNGRSTAFSITFETGGRCETNGWTGLICDEG